MSSTRLRGRLCAQDLRKWRGARAIERRSTADSCHDRAQPHLCIYIVRVLPVSYAAHTQQSSRIRLFGVFPNLPYIGNTPAASPGGVRRREKIGTAQESEEELR